MSKVPLEAGTDLIQEQDLRIPQQSTGDGDALLLPTGHLDALLPGVRVVAAATCTLLWILWDPSAGVNTGMNGKKRLLAKLFTQATTETAQRGTEHTHGGGLR